MKNKKTVYILLPLVALVWGVFIYRIYSGMHSSDDNLMPQLKDEVLASGNSFQPDTFSLMNNYRDPFLGKIIREQMPRGPVPPSPGNRPLKIVNWPSVVYSGMIKNKSSKRELAMVQINGQSTLMKVKDVIAEVQLLKIYKDSIQLKFGKEKRMVKK